MTQRTKYNTLEQLLHEYKQNGVDSEGQFTLNPIRARELLEQFQLPEPSHYALHLLCFLVGAGAKSIEIFSTRTQLRFEAPGASLDKETLSSPFSVLLRSAAEPHLSELALGLNAFLGQEKGAVELRFQQWVAHYTHKNITLDEKSSSKVLTIEAGARFHENGVDRELALIREYFRWSPVPIKINGQSLPCPYPSGPSEGIQVHLENQDYPLLLESGEANRLSKKIEAPFSALIRLWRHRPSLRIVHLGRVYDCELPWTFFLPGWQVDITVNSDRFKKDLSQQSILGNDIYHNLLLTLRVQLEQACQMLLKQTPALSASENLIDDLVEHLFLKGNVELALDFQRRLSQSLSLNRDLLQAGKALYRLALMEKSLGQEQAAHKLQLGKGMLEGLRSPEPGEPKWSILKANMAFNSKAPHIEPQVQNLLLAADTPAVVKEQCYRWLLRQGHQDPLTQSWQLVCLARQVYEAGRAAEAEELLDGSQKLLPSSASGHSQRDFDALELRAEIAVSRGQLEKALELFGRLLAQLMEKFGQYSLKLGVTLERLVALLECAGKRKEAKEYKAWSRRLHE